MANFLLKVGQIIKVCLIVVGALTILFLFVGQDEDDEGKTTVTAVMVVFRDGHIQVRPASSHSVVGEGDLSCPFLMLKGPQGQIDLVDPLMGSSE